MRPCDQGPPDLGPRPGEAVAPVKKQPGVCGIAGWLDFNDQAPFDPVRLKAMADALIHRGPDEEGFRLEPGVALASRRLAIVGLADGRQPISNEDGSVVVVYNGELFDYPVWRERLQARGHQFRTSTDTEILVHLWEDHQEGMLELLEGQFAFALVDFKRRQALLARDRVGIAPLFYTLRGNGLLFASEIKGLLASGLVEARLDPMGLEHVYTFFAMATRRTMFEGVQQLLPGHYLTVTPAGVERRRYWDLDFPDQGQEERGDHLQAELAETLERAVRIRLRADVPVVSYLSGGLDSTTVAALASRRLGRPIPTFTIRIPTPHLDETDRARLAGRSFGSEPTVLTAGGDLIAQAYPDLIRHTEAPVLDTSSAALQRLSGLVHGQGYKVTLTGEGADEALAGYPWFKVARLTRILDRFGLGLPMRRSFLPFASQQPWSVYSRRYHLMGGFNATSDLYAMCSLAGYRLYHHDFLDRLEGRTACDDLEINREAMQRWDPLNQALYLGYKVMLAGLLVNHKGDRPAMSNSVEPRFPFLDERVIALCARVDPKLKLAGFKRDKELLRRVASELLPARIARRPKNIFRATMARSFLDPPVPAWVEQLLSPSSLAATGCFYPPRVAQFRQKLRLWRIPGGAHMMYEMGLVGVVATQLWAHLFLGQPLCELPTWRPPTAS